MGAINLDVKGRLPVLDEAEPSQVSEWCEMLWKRLERKIDVIFLLVIILFPSIVTPFIVYVIMQVHPMALVILFISAALFFYNHHRDKCAEDKAYEEFWLRFAADKDAEVLVRKVRVFGGDMKYHALAVRALRKFIDNREIRHLLKERFGRRALDYLRQTSVYSDEQIPYLVNKFVKHRTTYYQMFALLGTLPEADFRVEAKIREAVAEYIAE